MIGCIKGFVVGKNIGNELLILVDGLGYSVFVGSRIFSENDSGVEIFLYTYHHIREDQSVLYGFLTQAELEFFKKLLRVSGVGPKMAMMISEVAPHTELMIAIVNGDLDLLTRVSGVGKKRAERIVLELKNKFDADILEIEKIVGSSVSRENGTEVYDALIQLGYTSPQAREMVKKIPDHVTNLSERITFALRNV